MMLNKANRFGLQFQRHILKVSQRGYYPDNVVMKRVTGEYYADPMDVGERVVRLFALHDSCKDPSNVTLSSSFAELGMNSLDMVELYLVAEREFNLEISEEQCESMHTVNDIVEFLAKNPQTA